MSTLMNSGRLISWRAIVFTVHVRSRNYLAHLKGSSALLKAKTRFFTALMIVGLTMNPAISDSASAASHIEVMREVLLESGVPAWPNAIISTPDGGFVILGALYEAQAWATRIDSSMQVIWRHVVEHPSPTPGIGISAYEGAVVLPDNSVLLCGYLDMAPSATRRNVGLLTRIGSRGEVLSRGQLIPTDDERFKLGYLRGCAAWKDGIAVVGDAVSVEGIGTPTPTLLHYLWFIGLDRNGTLTSQKLIPNKDQSVPAQLLVTANEDVALTVFNGNVLLDHKGTLKQWRVGIPNFLVQQAAATQTIQVISESGRAAMTTFDRDFRAIATRTGVPMGMLANRAYATPNGIALFGYRADQNGATTAAIGWLRSDLGATEVFTFKPVSSSPQVRGATPSGVPGEFAAVRPISPQSQQLGPNETRMGVMLTFVRYR